MMLPWIMILTVILTVLIAVLITPHAPSARFY